MTGGGIGVRDEEGEGEDDEVDGGNIWAGGSAIVMWSNVVGVMEDDGDGG